MKALCVRSDGMCLYLLDDAAVIDMSAWQDGHGNNMVKLGSTNFASYTSAELQLHSNVTETRSSVEYLKGTSFTKDSWRGTRYKYDGTDWTQNQGFMSNCEVKDCDTANAYNITACAGCGVSLVAVHPNQRWGL
jgi:hypothetical protein